MSSTLLKIIPASIAYVPDNIQQENAKRFLDLAFETSCKHQTSLNDLNYTMQAGFAKFF